MNRRRMGAPAVKPDVVNHKEELRPVTEAERRERDYTRLQARREFATYCVSSVVFPVIRRASHRGVELSPFEEAILVECDNDVINGVLRTVDESASAREIVIERRADLRATMAPTAHR